MKYDDASWHSGGEFPSASPPEYGGTHIALFMKWCFIKGWAGELHTEDEPEDIKKVINGELLATEFFFKYCDGKLTDEDFNKKGNEFVSSYYGDNGLYLDDYGEHFSDQMYVASEQEHDFEEFSKILEDRYVSGVLNKEEKQKDRKKSWWKPW